MGCKGIISLKSFPDWVSEALTEVKQMLISNKSLAEYVYGKDNADAEEVDKIKYRWGIEMTLFEALFDAIDGNGYFLPVQ